VASRVLDFFLVSHPMMPIYFTVAFLSHEFNRTKILKTDRSESQMHLVLRSLPLQLIEQDSCSLHTELLQETIEEVLEHSLRLIQTVPPYRLLEVATQHGQLRNNLLSITMFQRDVPSWGKKNFALTDWALLKQAKELRVGRTPPKISPRNVGSMALYPRAMVALGMDPPTKDRTGHQNCYKRNLLVTLVFGLIASVLFVRSFKSIQPNLLLKIKHLPTIGVEQNHFSNEPFKKIYHRRMKRQQSISHRPRVYKRNTKPLPFTKCSATYTWYEAHPLQNTSTHIVHNFNEETESEKMENNVVFEDVERNYATGSQIGLVRTVEKRFKVIPILRLGPIIKSLRKRIDNMTRRVVCVLMEASIFLIVD